MFVPFDRFVLAKLLNTAIEITAAGIEALTVIPTYSPRYTFAAVSINPKTMAKIIPCIVISGRICLAEI